MATKRHKRRDVTQSTATSPTPPTVASRYDCYALFHDDGALYGKRLTASLRQQHITVTEDTVRISAQLVDILTLIDRVTCVVVIVTDTVPRSDWVRQQLEYASRVHKPVLQIHFDDTRMYTRLTALEGFASEMLYVTESELDGLTCSPAVISRVAKWIHQQRATATDSLSHTRPQMHTYDASAAVDEGKLILLGRGEVGKTSLVRRLVADHFDPSEPITGGIGITPWIVHVGAARIQLNIWDFGGQEILHATHQFFLTEQSLYLVVLNGREGGADDDADYWLKHVEMFGGESPVIVVQNKIGSRPFDLNYRGLRSRYPQICDFIKTDCADRHGIHDLRSNIAATLARMPNIHVRMPIPVGES